MDEEMLQHIQMRTDQNVKSGMNPEEARRVAGVQFGAVESIKETCREQRAVSWIENLGQDVLYGARVLRKNPGFTAIAVLVLALGIGANTTIFSLVNGLLFKPIAARAPAQIVSIYASSKTRPNTFRSFSLAEFTELRSRGAIFKEVAAEQFSLIGIKEGHITRRTMAMCVSGSYFTLMGMVPAQGRAFLPEEDSDPVPATILTDGYWRRMGGDPQIVGKTITINAAVFTVVGIAPPGFTGSMAIAAPDVFLPLGMYDSLANEGNEEKRPLRDPHNYTLKLLGRLKSGVSIKSANAYLKVLASQIATSFPESTKNLRLSCGKLPAIELGDAPENGVSPVTFLSLLLLSISVVVLLIAGLNLANIMLARGVARRKEIAVRLALGARRSRIVRQLLTEGLMLSLLGSGFGLLIARWSMDSLVASMQKAVGLLTISRVALDWRVLVATLCFCIFATLLFALTPALKLSRLDVNGDLKEHSGEDARMPGSRRMKLRNLPGIGQVSLSLALLIVAGLFTRSALNAMRSNPGFDLDSGFFVLLDPSMAHRNPMQAREFFHAVTEQIRVLPGVELASIAVGIPFSEMHRERRLQRAGAAELPANEDEAPSQDKAFRASENTVGADYFLTLGVPLLRGREFTRDEMENSNAPAVAIIGQRLADQLWPGEDAIGRTVQFAKSHKEQTDPTGTNGVTSQAAPLTLQVVGIAPNLKEYLFLEDKDSASIYLPIGRFFEPVGYLHVRPRPGVNTSTLMSAVRKQIRITDAQIPVLAMKSLRSHYESSFYIWIVRIGATLFGVFASVGLFLALIGVYAVKAFAIARRTREVGIRMSLGATRGDMVRLFLREEVILSVTSLITGLVLGALAAKIIGGYLFAVKPFDPFVFATATALLGLSALIACWFPARRAARLDPMVALRHE
jgi:predicted permease